MIELSTAGRVYEESRINSCFVSCAAADLQSRFGHAKRSLRCTLDGLPGFRQTDQPWAFKTVGGFSFWTVGCVPTSLANIIQVLTAENVNPWIIGNQLHEAGLFNTNREMGTDGDGVAYILRKYNLQYETTLDLNRAAACLRQGGMIAFAVRGGVFCRPGLSHELVLYNYHDGQVQVFDLYDPANTHEYDLDFVFSQFSQFKGDQNSGGPAFLIRNRRF